MTNDDLTQEDEDEAAYQGLVDAGLSPEEAQEAIDAGRPVSDEEAEDVEDYQLQGMTRVDDAEHDQWLGQKVKQGSKAMDRVLEDASYGEDDMHDEEEMERSGHDHSGWGFRSLVSHLNPVRHLKYLNPVTQFKMARRVATMPLRLVKKFVPGRDGGKARLVRNAYRKLWYEHANWLAVQDKRAGLALKSRADYELVAKLWAKNELAKQNLPTSYAVGRAEVLGAEIMGSEVMGSWWNPLSWFSSKVSAVVNNTAGQRADQPPDEQAAQATSPGDMSTDASAVANLADQQPTQDATQATPTEGEAMGWNGVRSSDGRPDPVSNGDSLGEFAAQILGRPSPARDNPSVEKIVAAITAKLHARREISPGELGLLSTAAREGNESARRVLTVLQQRGVAVSGDDSGLDPWMYKLNPSYWFASKRKKEFVDKEKKSWTENAEARKKLAKQQEDLEAAERAEQAAQAVEKARAQSAETEAKLKAIADSLKGSVAGSFVGHEKPTEVSAVVLAALERAGKRDAAGKLYAKIRAGQPLTRDELRAAQQVARVVGRARVVHGDLIPEEEVAVLHGAFVGACVLGSVGAARERNQEYQQVADRLAQRVASGSPLSADERVGLARVLRGQQELRKFTTSLASGAAFVGCPPRERRTLSHGAFVGAAQAMSPEDKKMLAAIVKLAKVGNPRAQRALAEIKKSGVVVAGDSCGFSIKKFFKYATAPVWLPAAGLYKGQKALFGSKGGSSPEQVRLAQLRAANKRLKASQARAAAADAQNEAEQRAQEAIAAAADAEADAADAEAAAKQQASLTKETEAAPDLARQNQSQDDQQEDSSGKFVGSWTDFVGKGTRDARLVAKAAEESPTGTKIRAATRVYKRAKAGDPRAVRAVRVMAAKSRRGDQQATRDLTAVRAAALALRAKKRAQRKQLVAKVRTARRARVVAAQRKFEARAAERLARMSRRRELAKMARVERMAARGNPKARAYVARRVAAAKKGDEKAKAQVQAMRLGRVVRTTVKTRQERRNMRSAEKFARRVRSGNPRAVRQYRILQAAAARGNPNARRAMVRLGLAGAVLATVATGVVVLPRGKGKKSRRPAPGTPEHSRAQRQVADARERARAGVATREEAVAAARLANDLGDREAAGELAQASSKAPSATEGVKRAAGRVAAAQAGDAAAQKEFDADLEAARRGDADAVNKLGQVAAARTVAAVERGEPVPPAMRDAVNLQERARAGDPAAQEVLRSVSEAATGANPPAEATAAAVYATGAAAVASALASKPQARREFMERVNQPVPRGEMPAAQAELASVLAKVNEGTATPEEGERGVELAMRMHQPRVAAEISAKAPPLYRDSMSTLPDQPLPPVTGVRSLVRASLAALTFSTPDPLGNYREALASRGVTEAVSLGWSPFDVFKVFRKAGPALPVVAMLSAPVAAAASVANLVRGGRKAAPAPAPTPAPAAPPATPAESPSPASRKNPEEAVAGEDDSFRKLVRAALKSKKMSRDDFNRAVAAHVEADASKEVRGAAGEQVLKFMEKRGVKVG